ncbi:NAD-dependent epimerase/dehydratase family protein [Devosia chinhatensis]|uniref:UDP-glucuronate 5-epimerase n=1 Tax=Devosia chinhatensis TaxID=429727 RepID=A0A0F5FKE3_9HYPH|nr:NAD-dependent epimerase/dehydratase family protein [Devosia chinhatensis]KKB09268.1 UDP-glucuronate 5-epimerase [Devosia chinhatensis]
MKVFVTGAAGFIGSHLSRRLVAEGHEVLGYDGVTPYYDVKLKRARLALLHDEPRFSFVEAMLEDRAALERVVFGFEPDVIVHLAAQAGVRYSLENPASYISTNVVGTFNLLEVCRALKPSHVLLASTSSVYGANESLPFAETDRTDFPVSIYAATKKAGEALSHSYSHLFDIPTTNFRFFTVFGPWGRPDMALFKFVSSMRRGEAIEVYGEGRMKRDFTYIDDLVTSIVALMGAVPQRGHPVAVPGVVDSLSPVAPWRVVNIAGGGSVGLLDFIEAIEAATGLTARKTMLPIQPGEMVDTFADARLLEALTGFLPRTPVAEGVRRFVDWHDEWTQTRSE